MPDSSLVVAPGSGSQLAGPPGIHHKDDYCYPRPKQGVSASTASKVCTIKSNVTQGNGDRTDTNPEWDGAILLFE